MDETNNTAVLDRAALLALWKAANDHSTCVIGEWIPEGYDGQDYPPAPSDAEIVSQVAEYLRTTV